MCARGPGVCEFVDAHAPQSERGSLNPAIMQREKSSMQTKGPNPLTLRRQHHKRQDDNEDRLLHRHPFATSSRGRGSERRVFVVRERQRESARASERQPLQGGLPPLQWRQLRWRRRALQRKTRRCCWRRLLVSLLLRFVGVTVPSRRRHVQWTLRR